jgi:hypothetical protein
VTGWEERGGRERDVWMGKVSREKARTDLQEVVAAVFEAGCAFPRGHEVGGEEGEGGEEDGCGLHVWMWMVRLDCRGLVDVCCCVLVSGILAAADASSVVAIEVLYRLLDTMI